MRVVSTCKQLKPLGPLHGLNTLSQVGCQAEGFQKRRTSRGGKPWRACQDLEMCPSWDCMKVSQEFRV